MKQTILQAYMQQVVSVAASLQNNVQTSSQLQQCGMYYTNHMYNFTSYTIS